MASPTERSMNLLILTIPLVPPSVNHYVKHARRGIHYVTKEAKAFKAAVGIIAQGRFVKAKRYSIAIELHLAKGQRLDADNGNKCILDGLTEAGVIHSDSAVTTISVQKFRDPSNPRTEIKVTGL